VWDAFTHEGARGVRLIPWLEDPIADIGSHHLIAFRVMQDGSSLLGLGVALAFVCYGLRRGREHPIPNRPLRPAERRIWVLIYGAVAVAMSRAWLLWEPTGHSLTALANGIAVAALRGLATALLITSVGLAWRLRALRS